MDYTSEHVEQRRLRRQAYGEDTVVVTRDQNVARRRPHTRREMTQRLHSFLDGGITLTTFNTAFQQHVHRVWNTFRLQGKSSGKFLNRLVNYVPSEETLGHLFHLMGRVPDETAGEPHQIQAIVQFLERLIVSGQVTRAQFLPARVPFFLSTGWHVQDLQQWPIFYLKVRQASDGAR